MEPAPCVTRHLQAHPRLLLPPVQQSLSLGPSHAFILLPVSPQLISLRLPASLGVVLSGSQAKTVPIPGEPAEVQISYTRISWSTVHCVCEP